MNDVYKRKLIHDFSNSISIINIITKSSSNFVENLENKIESISPRQIELFKGSMASIENEICKIEKIFEAVISDNNPKKMDTLL